MKFYYFDRNINSEWFYWENEVDVELNMNCSRLCNIHFFVFIVFDKCEILFIIDDWKTWDIEINHYFIKLFKDVSIRSIDNCHVWERIDVFHIDLKNILLIVFQIDLRNDEQIDKKMTERTISEINNHNFRCFHWFEWDHKDFRIWQSEKRKWRHFDHQCFHFVIQIVILRVFVILVIRIEFFIISNILINSLIYLIEKTISEFSYEFFTFFFWMFRESAIFFLTHEASLFSSILIDSILIFSILIFSIFTISKWKVLMITTIDEKNLCEMWFLIRHYWRFQIINQFD
jgi:hypothetical protein